MYIAIMLFVLITKIGFDTAIADKSDIDQLRNQLEAYREENSVIGYLNSVTEPTVPIWYSRSYRGYYGSPEMLEEIFNRMVADKPHGVLELGSGLSTLIASYAIRKNGKGKVISWDCLQARAASNRNLITSHKQEKFSKIVDVKTSERSFGSEAFAWYEQEPEAGIDFLIVDDSGDSESIPDGRDVIRALKPHLNTGCTIFLHDSIRQIEKETLSFWLEHNDELLLVHTVRTSTNTYSVLRFGLR
jgi:hypothetical protein